MKEHTSSIVRKLKQQLETEIKKHSFYNWTLDDWKSYHANQHNKHDIPEITTRNFDPVRKRHVARVVPCQYEFTFLGHVFVSHVNPDPEPDVNDFHISELHTGFRLSFGFTRDSARASGRKILIHNHEAFKAKIAAAFDLINSKQWETEYALDKSEPT